MVVVPAFLYLVLELLLMLVTSEILLFCTEPTAWSCLKADLAFSLLVIITVFGGEEEHDAAAEVTASASFLERPLGK